MKFLSALSLALLSLTYAQAICDRGCRIDGSFRDAQIGVRLQAVYFRGGITSARTSWDFKHSQNNYRGKLNYQVNVNFESKPVCSSDGAFCIQDRLYKGSESKFGYTLYFNGECSNYWAVLKSTSCREVPYAPVSCDYDMELEPVHCRE
ncbi:hypothetical protein BGZ51_006814 [Haplosporangium sp. Z 767]|nr:hypothetical protein BGZ51_006814 [Haplosporangium sp. Z 767]